MITVIGNLKGGTGKSTVVFNLALWLAQAGRSVMVHDLDPQSTLVQTIKVRDDEGVKPTVPIVTTLPEATESDLLIDVGTSDMAALQEAMRRAERILIPCAPSQADIWATKKFVNMLEEVLNGAPRPETFAFINRADTHPSSRENQEAEEALSTLDVTVLSTRLSTRLMFRRSFSEGRAVFELEPRGKAAKELMALARQVFPDV